MNAESLQRAWVAQAQAEAERGQLTCRMCKRTGPLDEALTVWRNGVLVFAVCDGCCARHDVLIHPTDRGIEVRGRSRGPLVIGSRA